MKTIQYYAEMRHRLARSAKEAKSEGLRRELWTAFSKCDTSIAKLSRYYRSLKVWIIVVNVAVILSIFASGCQTFKGAMGDTAWLLQKGADNIQVQEGK